MTPTWLTVILSRAVGDTHALEFPFLVIPRSSVSTVGLPLRPPNRKVKVIRHVPVTDSLFIITTLEKIRSLRRRRQLNIERQLQLL